MLPSLENLSLHAVVPTAGFHELSPAEDQQLGDVQDPISQERPVHTMTFRIRLADNRVGGEPHYVYYSPETLWGWVKDHNTLPLREGPIWYEDWWALCNTYNPTHQDIPAWAHSLKRRDQYLAERRQAEEREARAREARARASEQLRNAAAGLRTPQMNEYVQLPDPSDFAVQWSFFVKGHIPAPPAAIWGEVRALFASHMREVWPDFDPGWDWGQRLGIQVLHGNTEPTDMPAQTDLLAFTRCRFRMHLHEAAARRFAEWLAMTIGRWGYVTAMDRVLGIRPAVQAGQAIAVMAGVFEEDTDATVSIMNSQESASVRMTYQEYNEWLPFQHTVDPEVAPVEAPPGGRRFYSIGETR